MVLPGPPSKIRNYPKYQPLKASIWGSYRDDPVAVVFPLVFDMVAEVVTLPESLPGFIPGGLAFLPNLKLASRR